MPGRVKMSKRNRSSRKSNRSVRRSKNRSVRRNMKRSVRRNMERSVRRSKNRSLRRRTNRSVRRNEKRDIKRRTKRNLKNRTKRNPQSAGGPAETWVAKNALAAGPIAMGAFMGLILLPLTGDEAATRADPGRKISGGLLRDGPYSQVPCLQHPAPR